MEIHYCLGTTNANLIINDETKFYGHIQSYEQCRTFIGEHEFIEESSSSRAAINMSKGFYSNNSVIICNKVAIDRYHLVCLKDSEGKLINPYLDQEKTLQFLI